MRSSRIILVALVLTLALAATACGSSDEVPEDAVAVVSGTAISKSELDELIAVAKKAYAGSKQAFPKAGTPEYQNIQTQYLAFLVQRAEFQQEADKLGVEVSEKDIDTALDELVESRFDGDRNEFDKALKQQGFTLPIFRKTLAASVLSQKLFDEVTKDVEVTEQDILLYYTQNQSQYEEVDYPNSKAKADRIYKQLTGGANFAELARKESADTGTASSGGKYTAVRGASVAAFDKVAFDLDTGEISQPVKTEFGYHVIMAVSPIRPAEGDTPESRDVRHILIAEKSATALGKAREPIRQRLLQERRTEFMTTWVESLRKRYEGKVSYAEGFSVPDPPDAPTETQ